MKVLQQVLQPFGEVQGEMAVYSEAYDCKGVRSNEDEEVLGWRGVACMCLLPCMI